MMVGRSTTGTKRVGLNGEGPPVAGTGEALSSPAGPEGSRFELSLIGPPSSERPWSDAVASRDPDRRAGPCHHHGADPSSRQPEPDPWLSDLCRRRRSCLLGAAVDTGPDRLARTTLRLCGRTCAPHPAGHGVLIASDCSLPLAAGGMIVIV